MPMSTPQASQIPVIVLINQIKRTLDFLDQLAFPVTCSQFQAELLFLRGAVRGVREIRCFVFHMAYGTVHFRHQLGTPVSENYAEMLFLGFVHVVLALFQRVRREVLEFGRGFRGHLGLSCREGRGGGRCGSCSPDRFYCLDGPRSLGGFRDLDRLGGPGGFCSFDGLRRPGRLRGRDRSSRFGRFRGPCSFRCSGGFCWFDGFDCLDWFCRFFHGVGLVMSCDPATAPVCRVNNGVRLRRPRILPDFFAEVRHRQVLIDYVHMDMRQASSVGDPAGCFALSGNPGPAWAYHCVRGLSDCPRERAGDTDAVVAQAFAVGESAKSKSGARASLTSHCAC